MATNDFLTFAGDPAANVIPQSQYIAAGFTARILGFSTGTALSIQLNKVWRQASLISAMIGQFTVDEVGQDMLDDGTPGGMAALESHFRAAITHVAQSAVGTGYLPLVGGTLTGPLYINSTTLQINAPAGQQATFSLSRNAGNYGVILGNTGVLARWMIQFPDGVAEAGSNSGSNLNFVSFNDAGAYLDTPMSINRASGVVNFSHNPTINGASFPYVRIAGDTMSGPLGVGGLGIAYTGMGGYWGAHRSAFGWDGANVQCAIDGTYIGAVAFQGWVGAVVGGYLPLAGGALSGRLTIHSDMVVDSSAWLHNAYFGGLGDFVNFWDGRYRFRQWAGSWYDAWDGATGLRVWATPSAWIMTLDPSGNLNHAGSHVAGGGRIISQWGGAWPSVCAYWTGGVAVGFEAHSDGMYLGNCDGSGNLTDWHLAIGNDGYFTIRSSASCNGNLWVAGQLVTNYNLGVAGTAYIGQYVHMAGSLQVDGNVTVNNNIWTNTMSTGGNVTIGGWLWAGGHVISHGAGDATVTGWSDQYGNAMGFQVTNQMNFGYMDGNGTWTGAIIWAANRNSFIGAGGVTFYINVPCDAALKTNIKAADDFDSLDAITRVPIVAFDWKERQNGAHVPHGIVAQQLQQVIPDAVMECPSEPMAGMKYLNEGAVIAHLFRAIGQLNSKIEALERLVT